MVRACAFFFAAFLACCSNEPERGIGRLVGMEAGVLRIDPKDESFELVRRGSVFACAGDVNDDMAQRWTNLTDYLLDAPFEPIDPNLRCVSFYPDHGEPSTCRTDVRADAAELASMASAAAEEECVLAAPLAGAQVSLPGESITLNPDGTIYTAGWVTEPCGAISSARAETLLDQLAAESRDGSSPLPGEASAELFIIDDRRWGDLLSDAFAVSEPLAGALLTALMDACGS